jgi:hypothetical protein
VDEKDMKKFLLLLIDPVFGKEYQRLNKSAFGYRKFLSPL